MKIIEAGEIGSCFGESLFEDLCERIENEGGWDVYAPASQVRKHLVEMCKNKLPERGFTVEATKEEISGIELNFGEEVTIVKKESK